MKAVESVRSIYTRATGAEKAALQAWMRQTLQNETRSDAARTAEARDARILCLSPGFDSLSVAALLKKEGWYASSTRNQDIARHVENLRRKKTKPYER